MLSHHLLFHNGTVVLFQLVRLYGKLPTDSQGSLDKKFYLTTFPTNTMSFPGHFGFNEHSAPRPFSYNTSLRRPWSPMKYDADIADNGGTYDYITQDQIPGSMLREKRQPRRIQNASEDSVEALDLADYAKTLRRPTTERNNPYPPLPYASQHHPFSVPTPTRPGSQPSPFGSFPEYPPSPDNNRPFSARSLDTFNQTPPSLVSGDTSQETYDSYNSQYPYPTRRPYSLPPFITPVSTDHLPTRGPGAFTAISNSPRPNTVHIASPGPDERDEADISRFPAFSRGWYDKPHKSSLQSHSSLPLSSPEFQSGLTGSYNPFPSTASNQARSILPWGSQLADPSSPPVDDAVKEERIRMLEHEFGKKGKPEVTAKPAVGSVDEKGALITVGPKKRVAARWAQGILSLTTAVSSLYGALVGIASTFVSKYLTLRTVYKVSNTRPTVFKTACFCSIRIERCYLFLCFLSLRTSTMLLSQPWQVCSPRWSKH